MQVNRKESLRGRIIPYLTLMRWYQPVGTWLLLWPCIWSITLASLATGQGLPEVRLLVLFTIGAVAMRSAGCVINDIWDQKIDAQVERTRLRPLASGQLTRKQAMKLLLVLLAIALAVVTQLNITCFILALIALPMVVLYPAMKRITWWPQAFLGLTFNFGALMGWAAVTGSLDAPAWWLYCAGIFWTLGYDTIYAHQDAEDDALIGVKSTARLFGKHSRSWISGFYMATTLLLALAVLSAGRTWITAGLTLLACGHLYWQYHGFNPEDKTGCLRYFKSNSVFGGLVAIALLTAHIIP